MTNKTYILFQAVPSFSSTESPNNLSTLPPTSTSSSSMASTSISTPTLDSTPASSSTLTYTVAPTTSTLALQGKIIILLIMRRF